MAEHHYVERTETGGGSAAGIVLGILVGVLVIALLFFFLVMPGRLGTGSSTTTQPNQPSININPSINNPPSGTQPNTGHQSHSGRQARPGGGSSSRERARSTTDASAR